MNPIAHYGPDGHPILAETGMTLRDWFAGQVMQGMVVHQYGGEIQRLFDPKKEIADSGDEKETPQSYVARVAYSLADAMIAERSKTQ